MSHRAVSVFVVLLIACSPTAPTAVEPAQSAKPTAEAPIRGGRVIDSGFEDVQSFDPVLVADPTSLRIISKIYDALVTVDARTGEVKPWLGQWTISPDGTTYTWRIDPLATWSDGQPITALDFLARVKLQARSRTTPQRSTFADIDGYGDYAQARSTDVRGITVGSDPKEMTVRLGRPSCGALAQVFGAALLPMHVFGKYIFDADPARTVDDAPENSAPPVASGPFRLREWRKGDQIVLVRNERYFKGAPYLEEYVYKLALDTTAQLAQLKTGELSLGIVRPSDAGTLASETRLRLHRWPENAYTFLAWVGNDPAASFLRDTRVRQALWHALDMDEIVRAAAYGEGRTQLQHHTAGSWAAAPYDQLDPYRYDPAKALALLRDAGFVPGPGGTLERGGTTLAFTIVTNAGNRERETFLRLATEQYGRIGIRVTARTESYETLVPKLTSAAPELQAVIGGWQLAADPDPYAVWHSSSAASLRKAGNNIVGYANAEIDRLIDLARSGPDCSVAARKKAYQRMNQILNADAPYVFGFTMFRILAADAHIRGITTGPYAPNGDANVHLWWIKP